MEREKNMIIMESLFMKVNIWKEKETEKENYLMKKIYYYLKVNFIMIWDGMEKKTI